MSRSHGQVRVEVDLTSSSSEVGLVGERARGQGLNGRGLEGRGMVVAVAGLWSRGRGRGVESRSRSFGRGFVWVLSTGTAEGFKWRLALRGQSRSSSTQVDAGSRSSGSWKQEAER
ncbi:hypothetical protein CDL15_Pgr024237 [Punica granatum]|uniref:Uncharacterized protein n=1 Tax=Punica granatum TaxID=22663 RepID=A0A218XY31_PUNGR|nr:hypothetical protein CDL15_Pgr024237 [Punica granatum]